MLLAYSSPVAHSSWEVHSSLPHHQVALGEEGNSDRMDSMNTDCSKVGVTVRVCPVLPRTPSRCLPESAKTGLQMMEINVIHTEDK